MPNYYPKSKVEVKGFAAKHYDTLMDLITFGGYGSFIKKAIQLMEIKKDDKILDLGAGTGRNACLMARSLSLNGKIVGCDVSEEMIKQFKKNCASFPNVKIVNQRIDKPLPYQGEFDKVFISFALHGFPQNVREIIIENARRALKNDGQFFILDYNKFSLKNTPFYIKIPFRLVECPYAFDFIKRDLRQILLGHGFENFQENLFAGKYTRLLKAVKID